MVQVEGHATLRHIPTSLTAKKTTASDPTTTTGYLTTQNKQPEQFGTH
jgi:hypothetical protein